MLNYFLHHTNDMHASAVSFIAFYAQKEKSVSSFSFWFFFFFWLLFASINKQKMFHKFSYINEFMVLL